MTTVTSNLSILRLTITCGETSAPYNQFSLPLKSRQAITLCSFYTPTVTPPDEIDVRTGNGKVLPYLGVVRQALAERSYDMIHVHDIVVANLFLLALFFTNYRLLSSSIFTLHTSYPNLNLRNRFLFLSVCLLFRKVVCCSKASYQSLPAFYRWLSGNRLTYIQNGMDIERLDRVLAPHRGPATANGTFTIIAIGRLIDLKNPLTLVKAFAQSKLTHAQLVFVGAGTLADAIRAEAEQLGVADQVTLTGLIPRDEVYQQLQKADLFVSTSYVEGLPIAVLEAMACRLPVILSDIAPHREIAIGHVDLPLIHVDDVDGFATAIRQVATLSSTQRTALGQRWRKIVEDHFSLTSMQRSYAAIYDEVHPPIVQKSNTSLAR